MTGQLVCECGWLHLPAPSGCDGDPLPAWWRCCLLVPQGKRTLNSNDELKRTYSVTKLQQTCSFCTLNGICSTQTEVETEIEKATLTLCSDGVRDWTGVTETISIHCSDHKEVDSSRLQVPQDKGLGLHMLSKSHPSVAECVTTRRGEGMKTKWGKRWFIKLAR